jgi:ADP-heptose:LPS heptosyltransferase
LEKKELLIKHNIMIEDYDYIDKFEDIEGVAALISNCDIVVTCSNVTAHIAGALGKKTFLYVPFGRGKLWYWHDEGGKSIWYPSIKIFTADTPGHWGEVFNEIANVIKQDLFN